jgi:carbon-monoxide dehydrogenase catalytic subunit
MIKNENKRSSDPAVQYLLRKANEANIETGWDRFDAMQDICGFGDLGLCCRNCMMGPCRIDPFGEGPDKGICGISSDGMVARNLCRMVATGTSAHSDHGAHILEVFEKIRSGEKTDFKIKDIKKLKQIANFLDIPVHQKNIDEIISNLVKIVQAAYSGAEIDKEWIQCVIPEKRFKKLQDLNILPGSIDPVIRETLHRTHMGVGADPVNLILGTLKCAISDFLGMDIASNLSDILLGTPTFTFSQANLGVIDPNAVNIAVHGHNPLITESILQMLPEFEDKAKNSGASNGINVVGVCCTGNEVLLRQGIPMATNAASQEIAVLTGAIDAMVVDVQCVMPSLANLCECFHTSLITTMSIAKIPGANHFEFDPSTANESAKKILELSIESFTKRDPKKIDIPDFKHEAFVGFTPEGILSVLSKINQEDPLQPLIETIAKGDIHGIVLFAGCNNYKVTQDSSIIEIAKHLAGDNVLLLATGCAAGAFAKHGFMSPAKTEEICGQKLKKVLNDLGHVAGLKQPLPPVWHMGSCIDNSRGARLAFAIAEKLNVGMDQLPLVASAPEAMTEKAVAIGTWAVALGITTHLGVVPPVLGGKVVTKILTETAKDLLGSHFLVETNPVIASEKIKEVLDEKRLKLGLG